MPPKQSNAVVHVSSVYRFSPLASQAIALSLFGHKRASEACWVHWTLARLRKSSCSWRAARFFLFHSCSTDSTKRLCNGSFLDDDDDMLLCGRPVGWLRKCAEHRFWLLWVRRSCSYLAPQAASSAFSKLQFVHPRLLLHSPVITITKVHWPNYNFLITLLTKKKLAPNFHTILNFRAQNGAKI